MDILRLVLLLGLVSHKLLWEVLKRQAGAPRGRAAASPSALKRAVKLAKTSALLFLVAQTLFLDSLPIASEPTNIRIAGTLIFFCGLATAMLGRLQLGTSWVDIEDRQVLPTQALVATGIYRYIRHPIYAGDMLLLVGLELALNSWLVLAMIVPIVVFVRQALAEEKILARAFGAYDTYRRRTKMFIPFLV